MVNVSSSEESSSFTVEEWLNKGSLNDVWSRDSNGLFTPFSVKGSSVKFQCDNSPEQVALLAAKRCVTSIDQCAQIFLPAHFKYCPDCGSELEAIPSLVNSPSSWLPPSAAASPVVEKALTGILCTGQKAVVNPQDISGTRADTYLAIPQGAEYRFIVGSFGFNAPRLIAIDIKTLSFFQLNPQDKIWQRLQDEDGYIADSALPAKAWGCVVIDPQRSDRLYFVCENGLVEVQVDIFNRQLRSRLIINGKAKASPVVRNQYLYVPMEMDDGVKVYQCDLHQPDEPGVFLDLPDVANTLYPVAIQDERKIVWLAGKHQLILNFSGDQVESSLTSWPAGVEPEFEFGVPARYHNQYWQLCFDHKQDSYCYVRLGGNTDTTEKQLILNPRMSTGLTHFLDCENYRQGEPWFVGEKLNDAGEVLLPVMEFGVNFLKVSSVTPTAVCIRLQSSDSLKDILNSSQRLACEVIMLGEPERALERFKVSRPWASQCFVYDGHLWLYHWGLKNISGWRLENKC